MLIGDNVIIQTDEGLKRPSDIGKPVSVINSWTLVFNTGVNLTFSGDVKFATNVEYKKVIYDKFAWLSLDNLTKGTKFGLPRPMDYSGNEWNPILNLEDYTSKSGEFNISSLDFAYAAAWFGYNLKNTIKKGFYIPRIRINEKALTYLETLFPEKTVSTDDKNYYFKKCWVIELVDAIFNIFEEMSIPDEYLLGAPIEWCLKVIDGIFSMIVLDKTKNAYKLGMKYYSLMQDVGLICQRAAKPFRLAKRKDRLSNSVLLLIKFPSEQKRIMISDGWENPSLLTLYDIGKGKFNISGIQVKEK